MIKPNKLTIVTIIFITLITTFTLYYKSSLHNNLVNIDKSYAYNSNSNTTNKYMSDIKKRIIASDKTFNESNYLISYNSNPSYPEIETITLTYVIDNLIETNKIYEVQIENNNIKDIYKSNSEETNELELVSKVNNFNESIKEKILLEKYSHLFKQNKILNKDKSINQNRFNQNITRYEEKYYYNYNTKELSYILNVYHDELEEIKIVID